MRSLRSRCSLNKVIPLIVMVIALVLTNNQVIAWSPETSGTGQVRNSDPQKSQPDVTGEGSLSPDRVLHYSAPLALSPHDHFLLENPLNFEYITWPTAEYRYGYPVNKAGTLHTGFDLPALKGTPVLASGDGIVEFAGYGLLYGAGNKKDPYGIAVKIRHTEKFAGYTIYTVYAHLQETLVKDGEEVKTGQTIGAVGLTGNTSGPHLHYEVRIGNEEGQMIQNPELWLTPPLEHGVLAGRITNESGYQLFGWGFILTSIESGREWEIKTYDIGVINRHANDSYYKENYVLSDLPAGSYEVSMWYNYKHYLSTIEINPGVINYINFEGTRGFIPGVPPDSLSTDFLN